MGNVEHCGGCDLSDADCVGGGVEQQHTVAMVGLDGAGKTTMCLALMELEGTRVPPPTGMADIYSGHENRMARGRLNEWLYYVPHAPGRCSMRILDLGGAEQHRPRWSTKYKEVKGLVFVVDAQDSARFPEAKGVLQKHVLSHVNSAQIPVLVLANVKDSDPLQPLTPAQRRELEADVKEGIGLAPMDCGRLTPASELFRPPEDKVHFALCAEPLWTKNLEDGILELRRSIVDNIKVLQGNEERGLMLR
eukprot:TRINITY_DN251_c2_g4_i2.p1 TRINITY_DN251_c2_g4~~TRINITY_DN251_c2_g4_i2.p1  ORF type:complete len:249 (+),score=44.84 TRINITY_DN251_c2_g4_i2:345-1091(+)